MAAQHAIAIYRDVDGDVENSFVLLRDGNVYSIEELVKHYFIKQMKPSSRMKIRIKVGNIDAPAELAWVGNEKIAEVSFEPADVIAIVSIKRRDNNWLWDSATLRFSSQRGSIMYDRREDKDKENLVVRVIDAIYFVPQGNGEKKVVIVSATSTRPLAVINRTINKVILKGDFDDRRHRDLINALKSLRSARDPPEAFPIEKLHEIENLLKKNGFDVYYNDCDIALERYVNELPVDDIKKIMSKGKRNIRIATNFDLDMAAPADSNMEMYVMLRNYSQYEDIVFYTRGRDVIASLNSLTDLAIQFNYCREPAGKEGRWYYYDLVPC